MLKHMKTLQGLSFLSPVLNTDIDILVLTVCALTKHILRQ